MAALGELKGLVVADVGAGTGLFSKALDAAVGPDGKVGGCVGKMCGWN
jgi:ubiquinone/menaquinone biosynthesis C-methylase UbiE